MGEHDCIPRKKNKRLKGPKGGAPGKGDQGGNARDKDKSNTETDTKAQQRDKANTYNQRLVTGIWEVIHNKDKSFPVDDKNEKFARDLMAQAKSRMNSGEAKSNNGSGKGKNQKR